MKRKEEIVRPNDTADVLAFSAEQYQKINRVLGRLERDIGAFGVLLASTDGQIVLRRGNLDELPLEEIITLMGGGIATLTEAGQVLDGFEDAVNLAYREGKEYNLYGLNIGKRLTLVMFINRSNYNSPLGSVWYYARKTADQLKEILKESASAAPQQILAQDFEQEVGNQLDTLLGLEEEEESPAEKDASFYEAPTKPQAQALQELGLDTPPEPSSPLEQEEAKDEKEEPVLLSFQEAIQSGILSAEVLNSVLT